MSILAGGGQQCPRCKRFFTSEQYNKKFCSKRCKDALYKRGRTRPKKVGPAAHTETFVCVSCRKVVTILVVLRAPHRLFCTSGCHYRYYRMRVRHQQYLKLFGYVAQGDLWVTPAGACVTFDAARKELDLLVERDGVLLENRMLPWQLRKRDVRCNEKVRST